MEHPLESERLLLRRLEPADLDLLCDLDGDPHVMRYLTGGAPTPRELIKREILPRFLRESQQHPGFGFWAAIEKATGEFLGWFSFRLVEERGPGHAELGYRLRRVAWGRGYATEGAHMLIRRGFAELSVQRVVASTYELNRASRRVMEKLGMVWVRSYRLQPEDLVHASYGAEAAEVFDGEDVEYALTREEWERRHLMATFATRQERRMHRG